jgi:hypothetical protein
MLHSKHESQNWLIKIKNRTELRQNNGHKKRERINLKKNLNLEANPKFT